MNPLEHSIPAPAGSAPPPRGAPSVRMERPAGGTGQPEGTAGPGSPGSPPRGAGPRPQAPNTARGGIGSFLLALTMHLLLFGMLFVGVRWQTQKPAAVQAELWAPSPPVEIAPQTPPPPPAPAVVAPPPPAPPEPVALPKPDIALERQRQEKARRDEERARQEALAKKEAQARKEEQARKDAQAKKDALEKKLAQEKKLAEERREAQRKDAEKSKQLTQEQDRRRDDYVKRMVSEAGPAERPTAAGSPAGAASGGASGAPNGDYVAKLSSLIRSNTVFVMPADMTGNPKAVFFVTVLPDCSIATVKLRRSSGHAGWDQAAERGIQRSDPLPKMPNGTCPRELEIARGPRDDR